jgi:hypothetical protein
MAHVRRVFLVPSRAGHGVIDRDPGRARQPSFQEGLWADSSSITNTLGIS